MVTFLLIDNNETDLYVHERVLKLFGFDSVKSSHTISEAWNFLKTSNSQKVIVFVDIQSILRGDWLTLAKPKEFQGELSIYVVDVIINERTKSDLKNFNTIKGFIEKPLTFSKMNEVLDLKGSTERSFLDEENLVLQQNNKNAPIITELKAKPPIL